MTGKGVKNSGSVIVVFNGLRVANIVRYGPTSVPCYFYHTQVEICYVRGKLGHRVDVCPDQGSNECRGCGISNPTSSHVCDPQCKLCGGFLMMAEMVCSKRYLILHVVHSRRQRARLEQQGQAEQAEDNQQTERGLSMSKKLIRSHSHSQSRGRTPAGVRLRDHAPVILRITGAFRGKKQRRRRDTWVNKVTGTSTTTPKENRKFCNTDKERITKL